MDNPWIPKIPTPRQAEFLLLEDREALYGGAAGGGKSEALLMGALQYIEVPKYASLILRRSYTDLALPGALMERSHEWLGGTPAKWSDKEKTWWIPGGGSLTFGYLEHEKDRYRYQSSEFQYIGFDELTQFTRTQFTYLFSRLRRLKGFPVPIRMRSGSNPGGEGHAWVKARYIDGKKIFIPAKMEDNPHLDQEEYEQSLAELDPVERERLRRGDWEVRPEGNKFKRGWFEFVDAAPAEAKRVRFWDMAATEPKPGKDPDWTAGVRMSRSPRGIYFIEHVIRTRARPSATEQLIESIAETDGLEIHIWMEQEPGSSGVMAIDNYRRYVLPGYVFRGQRSTGNKIVRADPLSSQAEAGNVKIVRGRWNEEFLDELCAFPNVDHDDQVDAASGAFSKLHLGKSRPKAKARGGRR